MWSLDVRELLSLAALGIIFFAMLFCMGSMVRTMYPGAEKASSSGTEKEFLLRKASDHMYLRNGI